MAVQKRISRTRKEKLWKKYIYI